MLTTLLLLATGSVDTLTIRLVNDHPLESETAAELREIYQAHDFRDWIVTEEIEIDIDAIPHSHPVLTIHTRHLGDRPALLATFVHEEFHWWVNERQAALDRAKAAFREIWPEVPPADAGGARDDESTYLHLAVCDLEYQATVLLLGEDAARETLARTTHYEWIYDKVLNDPRVREVMSAEGMVLR